MDTLALLFYTFAFVLVYAGFRVITAKSPVTAVLHLVLAFASASCVWMLLQAEFLAISLVLVYVGAVMVLFLFVVMMLDIGVEELKAGFTRYAWMGGITALVLVLEIVGVVATRGLSPTIELKAGLVPSDPAVSNTTELGTALYTHYLYPFELAAMLLLVAIVAAIVLTMRHREGLKVQDVAKQVATRREDRVRIVKVEAERRE